MAVIRWHPIVKVHRLLVQRYMENRVITGTNILQYWVATTESEDTLEVENFTLMMAQQVLIEVKLSTVRATSYNVLTSYKDRVATLIGFTPILDSVTSDVTYLMDVSI